MKSIKIYRKKLGITQAELAKRLNVGQSAVAFWENDYCDPQLGRLKEIAKVLKCTVMDLLEK